MQGGSAFARRLCRQALWGFLVAVAGSLPVPAARAASDEVRVAAVPPGGGDIEHRVTLPRVLSDDDAARYRRVFAIQEKGDWHAAGHEIEKLEDRLLMGHVMAQRYLHPTDYRSRFKELRRWLDAYADHPQARRIYGLAMRRKPANAKPPRPPAASAQAAAAADNGVSRAGYVSPRKRSAAARRELINLLAHIRAHVARGQLGSAAKHLNGPKLNRLADDVEVDIIRAEVAYAYFIKGDDDKAFDLAAAAAKRSGDMAPLAYWTAGLAAFRRGDLEAARRHFEGLAIAPRATDRMIAAGAYWAARVNLITRRPERVSRLLGIAADAPRTFYGLLAARALGETVAFAWEMPPITDRDMAIVLRSPGARRGLALAEIGQDRLAERELRRLRPDVSPALGKAMLALAARLDLPSAQLRIAQGLAAVDGRRHDAGMYPVPRWRPASGYIVDRALVFALMRQESGFNTRAKSRAGARGLMQLMPRTASFVARDRHLHASGRKHLFEPELNIELGQKYILHLLADGSVQGNLLFAVAAYNGGPGNLRKWLARMRINDDPLLFVEGLPVRETRLFVERVLTNLWIYRARLGQAAPSLEAIAGGRWPNYAPQDPTAIAHSADAGN